MEKKIQFHRDNYNELKDFLPNHYKIEVQSEKKKTSLFINYNYYPVKLDLLIK